MSSPEDYIALKWPDERLKRASGGWRAARAFRKMDQLVQRRGVIPSELWGVTPHRWQVAQRVSKIIKDTIGWTTDRFLPNDPVDILLWGGWYDLAEVEAIIKVEEQFVVDISKRDLTRIWDEGLTLGQFVDILLETSPCLAPWPLCGEESLEACTCPSQTAFHELRRFLEAHGHVESTEIRPSTNLQRAVPRDDWARFSHFLQARFGTRTLIRKRFLGVVSPSWAWLVLSVAVTIIVGGLLRWQAATWLLASVLCAIMSGLIVTRFSWLTWRQKTSTVRNVVAWILEERSHKATNTA